MAPTGRVSRAGSTASIGAGLSLIGRSPSAVLDPLLSLWVVDDEYVRATLPARQRTRPNPGGVAVESRSFGLDTCFDLSPVSAHTHTHTKTREQLQLLGVG